MEAARSRFALLVRQLANEYDAVLEELLKLKDNDPAVHKPSHRPGLVSKPVWLPPAVGLPDRTDDPAHEHEVATHSSFTLKTTSVCINDAASEVSKRSSNRSMFSNPWHQTTPGKKLSPPGDTIEFGSQASSSRGGKSERSRVESDAWVSEVLGENSIERGTVTQEDTSGAWNPRRSVVAVNKIVRKQQGKCLMNPETSRFLKIWDNLIIFALLFTCIVTPYVVCVLGPEGRGQFEPRLNWGFIVEVVSRVVDVIFNLDIVLQFFVMYQVDDRSGVKMERSQWKIAIRYVKGMFVVDVISCVPLDLAPTGNESSTLAFRVFRLLKLVRIARLGRLFSRLESRAAISYGKLALIKFFLILFLIIHWLTCLWCLSLLMPADDVSNFKRWIHELDPQTQESNIMKYLAALYFTSYTITSVGYGDITPVNTAERIIAVIMLVVSGITWAVVVGHVFGIVSRLQEEEDAFRSRIDEMSYLIKDRHLDNDLRWRILAFTRQNRTAYRRAQHRELIAGLSHGLQGEVFMQICGDWISKVSFLAKILERSHSDEEDPTAAKCHEFVIEFCSKLKPVIHAKGEFFGKPHTLYILLVGLVGREGRVRHSGSAWGEDFMLADSSLQNSTRSCALVYTELMTMDRETFQMMIRDQENRSQSGAASELVIMIRWFCAWLALQRAIMKRRFLNLWAIREAAEGLDRPVEKLMSSSGGYVSQHGSATMSIGGPSGARLPGFFSSSVVHSPAPSNFPSQMPSETLRPDTLVSAHQAACV